MPYGYSLFARPEVKGMRDSAILENTQNLQAFRAQDARASWRRAMSAEADGRATPHRGARRGAINSRNGYREQGSRAAASDVTLKIPAARRSFFEDLIGRKRHCRVGGAVAAVARCTYGGISNAPKSGNRCGRKLGGRCHRRSHWSVALSARVPGGHEVGLCWSSADSFRLPVAVTYVKRYCSWRELAQHPQTVVRSGSTDLIWRFVSVDRGLEATPGDVLYDLRGARRRRRAPRRLGRHEGSR